MLVQRAVTAAALDRAPPAIRNAAPCGSAQRVASTPAFGTTATLTWRTIMKALIAALALVTLIASPSFAPSYPGEHVEQSNVSPASPNFGDNGY